jgi:multidrug transporter EmrE-like cation transporter
MILLIIVITLLANLADVLLKLGARDAGSSIRDPLVLVTIPWVWLGAVSGVVAMALWIYVLGRHHLSHAYPVFVGLSFLNISLAAVIFFGEEIGTRRLLGIALILAGIFVVHFTSREKGSGKEDAAPAAPPGAAPSEELSP